MVRKATTADIPGLTALLLQVGAIHHDLRPDLFKGGTVKYTPAQLADIIADPQTPVFVADDGQGRILGHAFCQLTEVAGHCLLVDAKTLYIDDICVDSQARGRHVGRALFDHVRDYAKAIGCYNITLNVWEGNTAAQAFYRSMGMAPQKTGMEMIVGSQHD